MYRIKEVLAGIRPPLFRLGKNNTQLKSTSCSFVVLLEDLNQKTLKRLYYRRELVKTSKPKPDDYFHVEKILDQRKQRGKKYFLVKYAFYDSSFNQW